jgi:hypothetical protein
MDWYSNTLTYVCEDCGTQMTPKDVIKYLEQQHPFLKGIDDGKLEQPEGPSDNKLYSGRMYTAAELGVSSHYEHKRAS